MNTGFKKPEITSDNFILGGLASLPPKIINPSGDWTPYLPKFEPQRKQLETWNCVAFATIKCVQILLKKLGVDENYSDRFTGITAGTKVGGNDPHTVAQAIRHFGLIPESMLPFSDDLISVEEYFSYKGGDEEKCLKEGQNWLENYGFGHEYVFTGKTDRAKMIDALRYSPLGVSVFAWKKRSGIYFKDSGDTDNHWTAAVVGYEKDKYWLIADSYLDDDEPIKKLDWYYPFSYCKRYSVEKKTRKTPTRKTLLDWLKLLCWNCKRK